MKQTGKRYAQAIKDEARDLRRTGLSLSEIATALNATRPAVLYWTRDIQLSKEQNDEMIYRTTQHSRAVAVQSLKKRVEAKRNMWRSEALQQWKSWRFEPFFLFGIGLYWGEGSKGKDLELTNSDVYLARQWVRWCHRYFPNTRLRYKLAVHDDVDRQMAWQFWSNILHFKQKPVFIRTMPKSSRNRSKRRLPNGTVRVVGGKNSRESQVKMKVWLAKATKRL